VRHGRPSGVSGTSRPPLSGLAQRTPWFDADAETLLDAERATAALRSLPADQREVITLALWSGLTFEQIGELIGCSSSTAHRWYVAGLATLRERLNIHVRGPSP
jgi:RNA polymerase sigma factor (sigma-70 family)